MKCRKNRRGQRRPPKVPTFVIREPDPAKLLQNLSVNYKGEICHGFHFSKGGRTMKCINNLTVDVEPLAQGLYKLICEAGDEAVVAHGMIPHGMIELLRRLLREKILAIAAQQRSCTVEDLTTHPFLHLDEKRIAETIQTIEHAVVVEIFAAAKRAN